MEFARSILTFPKILINASFAASICSEKLIISISINTPHLYRLSQHRNAGKGLSPHSFQTNGEEILPIKIGSGHIDEQHPSTFSFLTATTIYCLTKKSMSRFLKSLLNNFNQDAPEGDLMIRLISKPASSSILRIESKVKKRR